MVGVKGALRRPKARHDYSALAELPAIDDRARDRSVRSMAEDGSRRLLEGYHQYFERHGDPSLLCGRHGARGLITACAIVREGSR